MDEKNLAHYSILDKLGAGGMGEVYRAEDTKLGRQVAIKVLPEDFAGDEERMARFEREARTLAALNHPNIATLYGLEEAGDKHFLVMELVEGETLDQKLAKGALSIEEALEVCRQIAEAVEAAHDKGIIHRDLKPANVKITPEGRVKVLDFGLAKALIEDQDGPVLMESPTLTARMTQPGIILGTAPYMSPEQAKGKAVDKRTDIWAFGCILYECLTGKMAFSGEPVSEVMAAIIKDEPDWNKLLEGTPISIRRLLRRCLIKDPRRRLRDIGDAGIEILDVLERQPDEPEAKVGKQAFKRPGVLAAVFLLGIILGSLLYSLIRRTDVKPASIGWHFSGTLPAGEEGIPPEFSPPLAFSPDGTRVILCSRKQLTADSPENSIIDASIRNRLYLLDLKSDFAPIPLEGTEGAKVPFFSPDGDSIGFVTEEPALFQLKLGTGIKTKIIDLPTKLTSGATWGPDNTVILAVAGSGLLCLRPGADKPEAVTQRDLEEGETGHFWPAFLPGGRFIVFTCLGRSGHRPAVLDLDTARVHPIGNITNASCARFLPPDKLIYVDSGDLFAARLDQNKWEIVGEPVKMISGIFTYYTSGLPYFSVSRSGSLVFCPGHLSESWRKLVLVDRDGSPIPLIPQERAYIDPRFSPKGKKLAVTEVTPGGALGDIFVYEISSGRATRLTTDGNAYWPRWTPDGSRVTYGLGYGAIAWKPVLEEADEKILWKDENPVPSSWHKDGDVLIFEKYNIATQSDIFSLPLGGEPEVIVGTQADERFARLNPDGNWLAYTSDESGRYEIYVRPFPGTRRGEPVTSDGGDQPVWSFDGRHIYYLKGKSMMVVPISTSPELEIGDPGIVFEHQFLTREDLNTYSTYYDVSPDNEHFVMLQGGRVLITRYNVILNWSQEVERRLKDSK